MNSNIKKYNMYLILEFIITLSVIGVVDSIVGHTLC